MLTNYFEYDGASFMKRLGVNFGKEKARQRRCLEKVLRLFVEAPAKKRSLFAGAPVAVTVTTSLS